jgi:hypothetical protein
VAADGSTFEDGQQTTRLAPSRWLQDAEKRMDVDGEAVAGYILFSGAVFGAAS